MPKALKTGHTAGLKRHGSGASGKFVRRPVDTASDVRHGSIGGEAKLNNLSGTGKGERLAHGPSAVRGF